MTLLRRAAALLLALAACFSLLCSVSAEKALFTDTPSGAWYYADVAEMASLGYLNGYPDGSFRPNGIITGAEFVSVLARAGGLTAANAQNTHWAGGLLQAALERGWYDWDELPPTAETYDAPITRQIAVKILMNAFAPGAAGDYNTESAKMADFAALDGRYYAAVIAAYSLGIVKGDNNGNFRPKATLTRAEACALIARAMRLTGTSAEPYTQTPVQNTPAPAVTPARGGVSENGHLQVIGTQLCGADGQPVILRGMSSHGLQWYPQFLSREVLASTAAAGANLCRIAMYTAEGGYLSRPAQMKNAVITAADTALSLDLYTIIDWHILSDGDPMAHLEESKAFFTEMAARYKGNPGVLYEICNEPNGNITWSGNVKPYAEAVITAIRAVDPDAIILVGSPTWSQDLHEAAKSPLSAKNILYTCHFYAGTHTGWLRDRVSAALRSGLPVFISEWGTSDASGSGGVYLEEAARWLDFLEENGISWACWSLCDKNESSAAVKTGSNVSDGIQSSELTESGRFVFSRFGS